MDAPEQTSTVTQLLDEYAAAVYDKDAARLERLYDDGVRVFDMWDSWSYEGLARWRDSIAAWFASLADDRVAVAFESVRIETFGACAVANAFVTYTRVRADGARDRAQTNRLTWVVAEAAGRWSVRHEHTSAPVDPESGEAKLMR